MEDESLYEKYAKRPKNTTLSKQDTILATGGPQQYCLTVGWAPQIIIIGKYATIVTSKMGIVSKQHYVKGV